MPLVSIVIPNYNHARFLRQRMDSVLGQTFQDFEVILLDDASTDGSREIIESYRDSPRVRILYNDKNSGSPFAQWARGIEQSRGRYLWIAESDDASEPELLSGLIARIEDHPKVVVAYCASRMVDESGRDFGVVPNPKRPDTQARFGQSFERPGDQELGEQLLSVCNEIPNASSALFRLDAVRGAGPADASYRLIGDWQFYARVLLLGSVSFTPDRWNRFRHHAQTARELHHRTGRRWTELCRFYDWALRLPPWAEDFRVLARRKFAAYLVSHMRASRSAVGVPVLARVVWGSFMAYPWLRKPLFQALGRQGLDRLKRAPIHA